MTVVLSDAIIAKAERLLVDRAVHVPLPTDGVVATVDGDSGRWTISRHEGRFSCSCPAVRVCSHLLALSFVSADMQPEGAADVTVTA